MSLRAPELPVRTRGGSHFDFKTATTGVAAKAMRNEIAKLVSSVQDAQQKKVSILVG
jgi:UTP--glucose-1-phosphate uridylyltransferase